jgi:hypothetical protein
MFFKRTYFSGVHFPLLGDVFFDDPYLVFSLIIFIVTDLDLTLLVAETVVVVVAQLFIEFIIT